jgi:tRNA(adenine34) deaminase
VSTIKTHEDFMREAIKVATRKGTDPAVSPIGCVIVVGGTIIAAESNHVAEKHEAVAHAERR